MVLVFDHYLELVAYLNLLQLAYNVISNKENLVNDQLREYPVDQVKFFEYYHMFSNHFALADKKDFVHQS